MTRDDSGRGLLLASVAIGWFFALGLRFVLPGILPTIRESFPHATETQAGIAITMLWATYGLTQFPAGIAADRVGEARVLVASLVLAAASLLAFTFTPVFSLFVVVTGLFGAATGLYGPPRGTLLARVFSDRADRAIGLTLAAGSLGAAALPAIAALVVDGLGWRVTLGLAAPGFAIAAVAVHIAARRTDDGRETATPRPDGGDPESTPTEGGGEPSPSIPAAIRAAAGSVRNRRAGLAIVAAIVMYFGFQGITALVTIYLVDERALFTQGEAGVLFGGLFVVGALSQWLAGWIATDRRSARVLAGIAAVSVFPLIGLVVFDHRLLIGASVLLIGIRMGFAPVSNAFIIDCLPAEIEGTAWGGVRSALFVVSSLASTMVGILADIGRFDGGILVLAALTGFAAVLYLALPSCEARRLLGGSTDESSG
ncbi:MFS transporter [Halococcoides cellulosivorans]|uniref:MFS transporter n=1 Tax=Halococcoides cellulosivorans TaxID=1679096 RepID=UPI00131F2FAC|nr:MFS transporter [Halococcoides cellulosivorans]